MQTYEAVETLGLPVNREACFTDHKGNQNKGIVKQQSKLLQKIAPLMKQFLQPQEEIMRLSTACSPMSAVEQVTTGWVIYYIKRCVLVFTNLRILHIPAKSDYTPKQSIAEVWYGDIQKYKVGGFLGRRLSLTYKNCKKTEMFYYIPSKEDKKLKVLLPTLIASGRFSESGRRRHLCPRCTAPLQEKVFKCTACHLSFKDKRQALLRSLLIPGGGYFYTGHPILGIFDAIVEMILLLLLLGAILDLTTTGGEEALAATIVLAVILFVEKILTYYHASHYLAEYIPTERVTAVTSVH